jgi:hypothetical protein
MMKNPFIFNFGLLLILGACTSPPDTSPRMNRIFIGPQLESFELRGQNLQAKSVRIAQQNAEILEVGVELSRVKVKPVLPLALGEYQVEITLENGNILSLNSGITVLEASQDIPDNELGNPDYRDESVVKGEAVVIFEPTVNQTQLENDIEKIGFEIERKLEPSSPGAEGLPGDFIWQIQDTKDRTTSETLTILENEIGDLPDINLKISYIGGQPPSLESKPLPTNLEAQTIPARTQALPADLAKARVAVLDTGVNAHKFFDFGNGANFIDTAATKNFTSEADNLDHAIERGPDGRPPINASAVNLGHGTAVTGVVLNTLSNALGVDNVRANADRFIVPVKVCEGKIGRCRALDVALGIYYAINQPNVKVINLSVGNRIGSSLILEALEAAQKKGVTVVISAGNQGENPKKPSSFPAAYNVINASGKVLEDLISVGSIREDSSSGTLERLPSAFSSEGAWVDLVANGEKLRSSSAASVDAQGEYTGTSFSAPQVSALAAIIHAKDTTKSLLPKEVKTFLLSKASSVLNCAVTKCGQGVVDPRSILLK